MLYEYAVEPKAIGSSWHSFRYLIEKFGFDRGRLISQFPKKWMREVIEFANHLPDVEKKRIVETLSQFKTRVLINSNREYDSSKGSWLKNAIEQQRVKPFHAIIASENPEAHAFIVIADDANEANPLMVSPHNWEVDRVGVDLADAMAPLLRSASTILFVDRFFDISQVRYKETLKACLGLIAAHGVEGVRCEIHYGEHDSRPPTNLIEQNAGRWLAGVIPDGLSIALFGWKEKNGGADLHARYLLTDRGGVNVEAGFSAEGAHQKVQVALLDMTLCQRKMAAFARSSTTYELVEPVLEIFSDGRVRRV